MQTDTFYIDGSHAQDCELNGGLLDTTPKKPPIPNSNHTLLINHALSQASDLASDWASGLNSESCEVTVEDLNAMLESSFNIALDAFCNDDLEKAELIAKEVVRANPIHISGIQMLGVIAIRKLDWPCAEAFFKASLIVNGADVDALSNLGLTALNQGKLDSARMNFKEALEIEPRHVINLCNLSETEHLLGNFSEAYALAKQAVRLDPGAPLARMQAARTARVTRHYEDCIIHLKKAVELIPDDTALVVSLIGALIDSAEFDEAANIAIKAAKAATRQGDDEDLTNIWRLAGVAELNRGQFEAAENYLTRALSYGPDDERTLHFLSAARRESPDCAPASYVSALFDSCADSFDIRLKNDLNYHTPDELVSLISDASHAIPEPPRLLDLGCGTGLMIEALIDRSEDMWRNGLVCGVDLSESMLLRAASKGVYHDLRLMDVVDYLTTPPEGSPESWHLITAADLTPYIGNLEPLFAAVTRRLAPEGQFAVSVESIQVESIQVESKNSEVEKAGNSNSWMLSANGRFSHNSDYVASLAAAHGLTCIKTEACHLRQDAEQPVEGQLFLFVRDSQATPPSSETGIFQ